MPQTKRYKEPFIDTDPSGHCPWCIVIAIGIVAGAVSSGIQSDWDLEATLLGGVIGGVSAGVGYGTFGQAATAFASLGSMGSGIAGGAVAGAVAGGTSGILANPGGARLSVVYQTPYEIRPITNFTTMGGLNISGGTISLRAFTFALERISLNYRSDVMIHVYGEGGQIGYFDVPLNYQGSQFGAPAH